MMENESKEVVKTIKELQDTLNNSELIDKILKSSKNNQDVEELKKSVEYLKKSYNDLEEKYHTLDKSDTKFDAEIEAILKSLDAIQKADDSDKEKAASIVDYVISAIIGALVTYWFTKIQNI